MKCRECGLCISVEDECEFAWQCNLTGESWTAPTPAGINRPCFASAPAKTAFIRRLLAGSDNRELGSLMLEIAPQD